MKTLKIESQIMYIQVRSTYIPSAKESYLREDVAREHHSDVHGGCRASWWTPALTTCPRAHYHVRNIISFRFYHLQLYWLVFDSYHSGGIGVSGAVLTGLEVRTSTKLQAFSFNGRADIRALNF
jgi:hypothetical protein